MATKTTGPRTERRIAPSSLFGWGAFVIVLGALVGLGLKTGACPSEAATWIQLAVTGLTLGSLYAMIALGYTMVYGVLQLLNFAHSEVFMVGTFAGLYTVTGLFGITDKNHPGGLGGIELIVVLLVAIALAAVASG